MTLFAIQNYSTAFLDNLRMDMTDFNALVQSTERSLHFKCKNRFSIKQFCATWWLTASLFVRRLRLHIFHLHGHKSESDSKKGRTANCETWLHVWPWQRNTCIIYQCFPQQQLAKWMLCRFSVTSSHGWAKIWIPTSGWFLRISECRPTKIWPFPPHSLLPTLDIVATIKPTSRVPKFKDVWITGMSPTKP